MRPLTAEQQDRAMTCYRLAGSLADRAVRRSNVPYLRDEVRGQAMLGLVKAAAAFDPARGTKFTTLVHHVVSHDAAAEAGRVFRKKRDRRRERLTASPPERWSNDPEPDENGFERLLALLPVRTAGFARLFFGEGLSCPAIGRRYGVSGNAVNVAINKGLAKLRDHPDVARHRETAS